MILIRFIRIASLNKDDAIVLPRLFSFEKQKARIQSRRAEDESNRMQAEAEKEVERIVL